MVDDNPLLDVHDQIMEDGRQREIAGELDRIVDVPRSRRQHLHDDDGVRNFNGVVRLFRSAIDKGIGFIGRDLVHPDSGTVRHHMARDARFADRRQQRGLNGEFGFGMPEPLRRHGVNFALGQLIAARIVLGPGQELVHGHLRFCELLHAVIIPDRERPSKRVCGASPVLVLFWHS